MSILNALHRTGLLTRLNSSYKFDPARFIALSFAKLSENSEERNTAKTNNTTVDESVVKPKVVSVETSINYMTSDAYKQTYGDEPVWKPYRRNHKGLYPPKKTRKTCIRGGVISTGNPCPICRDEYLVLDHRNIKLLEQFINKYNGDTLSYKKTGICQKKHKELLVALVRAKDYGTITFDLPRRQYDYSEWQKSQN